MRVLITAGPTREAIDPVRYIGNRSSGKMGAAIVDAAFARGHSVTAVLGPVFVAYSNKAQRIDVESAKEMLDAVLREFPGHDLLIMAAAVSDYRPVKASAGKIGRQGKLALELEPTDDVVAAAGRAKRSDQRTVGFSLESSPDMDRVRQKLRDKSLDMVIYNPVRTIGADSIEPVVLYPDGREERVGSGSKGQFADMLIQRAEKLF
jgi:phosphopantothenoylcysteine decarboxylase/phosphopantothenate--cysteine ligase